MVEGVEPTGAHGAWGGVWNLSKPLVPRCIISEIEDATCRGNSRRFGKHNTTCNQMDMKLKV